DAALGRDAQTRIGMVLGRAGLGGRALGRAGRLCSRDEAALLEEFDDLPRRLLGGLALGLADDLGVFGRLVGIRDAGELLDLAGASLRVEPLDIAVLARLD